MGTQPAKQMDKARGAILGPHFGVLSERGEDIRLAFQLESGRRDADDGVRLAFENQRRADRFGIPAEAALPETVADDDYPPASGLVFLRQERASLQQRNSQYGK